MASEEADPASFALRQPCGTAAKHLFEGPSTLPTVGRLAADWFIDHLARFEHRITARR